ncbi:MAG: hypothetical protein NWE98_00825 [Candidatus Bathyarchaeota archaeon]|nr:hypothetical protein [Candidatus Bathyarchaeota archaeon]
MVHQKIKPKRSPILTVILLPAFIFIGIMGLCKTKQPAKNRSRTQPPNGNLEVYPSSQTRKNTAN